MKDPGFLEAFGLGFIIIAGLVAIISLLDLLNPSGLLARLFLLFLAHCCVSRASWDSLGWRWAS